MSKIQNLFDNIPASLSQELFQTLAEEKNVRVERIVSEGHATVDGEWYNQDWDEWIIVISGGAGILFDGEITARILKPGDYVTIPAGCCHRVEWTATDKKTIWLAVHFGGS
jgi:cupin 2 domain-containing protein